MQICGRDVKKSTHTIITKIISLIRPINVSIVWRILRPIAKIVSELSRQPRHANARKSAPRFDF